MMMKFPTLQDVLIRYNHEIVIHKKSRIRKNKTYYYILKENFVNYVVKLINSSLIAQYRDIALRSLTSSSFNRRLEIISNCFVICIKE